ncbi:lysylphosphatidylglycerol synthase transmembrane domain-containing protein [Candidatus Scalindua japonica]|uniref:lysylphosphatidylglycerol synthase transmembrane domain-containing protein n=1 Tax=Candidatus Scalindua japonica TaxID=1284222 RepID=UPI000BDEBC93|nr:lysylphosphatidylglycerol synthase transmembrane domain-containing protein [Candidatus Scalindua japonica]
MDRKKIILGIKIFVAISLASQLGIFFYTSYQNGGISFDFLFKNINYCMLSIAFFLSWFEGLITGVRIYFLMRVINPRITMFTSIKAAYANIFMGAITPSQTGGGVAQIYFISRDKIPYSQASAGSILSFVCTLFFLITALISTAMFNSPTMGYSLQLMIKSASVAVGTMTLIFILCMFFTHLINNLKFSLFTHFKNKGIIKDKNAKIENFLKKFAEGLVNCRESILLMAEQGKMALMVGYLFTCFFFAVRLVIPYFIIVGLGGSVNVYDVMYIQLFIILLSYFSPTPGASGIAEISSLVLMASCVATPIAAIYTFLWRLCTLYVNTTIGGLLLYQELKNSE